MFEVLVESGGRRHAALGPRFASLSVHGGLIALAAFGVKHRVLVPASRPDPIPVDIYVAPDRGPSRPVTGDPRPPIVSLPAAPPSIPIDVPRAIPQVVDPMTPAWRPPTAVELAGRDLHGIPGGQADGAAPIGRTVLLAGEVDQAVEVLVAAKPIYPRALAAAGIAGLVQVEFVVDTAGACEPASVRIVRSSHPGFDDAARTAVCASTYRPGRFRGQVVRQLVRQQVAFRLGS